VGNGVGVARTDATAELAGSTSSEPVRNSRKARIKMVMVGPKTQAIVVQREEPVASR
jgi:hypothetical protein